MKKLSKEPIIVVSNSEIKLRESLSCLLSQMRARETLSFEQGRVAKDDELTAHDRQVRNNVLEAVALYYDGNGLCAVAGEIRSYKTKPEQEPKWCEHIRWNSNPSGCGFGGPRGWIYHIAGSFPLTVPNSWGRCPIANCGAPRPEQEPLCPTCGWPTK